ncbi:hypothetical protein DOY81_006500 [Sarcophaga bullata]|nr:hypothetical protein DOY81_006500 [Sarcophaga bullata]
MFNSAQLIFTGFVALMVLNVEATTLQYKGNMKHPELDNHCYFTEHKLSIKVNETAFPTNLDKACIRVFCRDDYVLEIKHCDKIAPNQGCHYSANDYTKPYPECCPLVTCGDKQHRSL